MKSFAILALLLMAATANATNNPPPPPKAKPVAVVAAGSKANAAAVSASEATGGAATASVGDVVVNVPAAAEGSGDTLSAPTDVSVAGDETSFTTKNKAQYINLMMAPVNIEGCLTANHIGGGNGSGGGLVQWAGMNQKCFQNALADAERHVVTRAKMKCAIAEYRDGMAFTVREIEGQVVAEQFKGNKAEKQAFCIEETIAVIRGQIDYLSQLVNGPSDEAVQAMSTSITEVGDGVERVERKVDVMLEQDTQK